MRVGGAPTPRCRLRAGLPPFPFPQGESAGSCMRRRMRKGSPLAGTPFWTCACDLSPSPLRSIVDTWQARHTLQYASETIISRLVWNVKRDFSTIATFVWWRRRRARAEWWLQRALNAITWSRGRCPHAPYKIRGFAQCGTGVRYGRQSCALWKWRPRPLPRITQNNDFV